MYLFFSLLTLFWVAFFNISTLPLYYVEISSDVSVLLWPYRSEHIYLIYKHQKNLKPLFSQWVKESTCQCRRLSFDPWVWMIPWRRKWQPALIFLPEKSHGQRSLVGYRSLKKSDMTEWLSPHAYIYQNMYRICMLNITKCCWTKSKKIASHQPEWISKNPQRKNAGDGVQRMLVGM